MVGGVFTTAAWAVCVLDCCNFTRPKCSRAKPKLAPAKMFLRCKLLFSNVDDDVWGSLGGAGRRFHGGMCGTSPRLLFPLMVEAATCKEVLSWLKNKGVLSVELCTDCSQLRSGLSAVRPTFYSYVGLFVDACKGILSSFSHSIISLESRTTNVMAHTLASAAVAQVSIMYWDLVPPDIISDLLY